MAYGTPVLEKLFSIGHIRRQVGLMTAEHCDFALAVTGAVGAQHVNLLSGGHMLFLMYKFPKANFCKN